MYTAVLVDDEAWILESLKGTVDWNELGFEIVATAVNGIEGFDCLARLKPDIAFVDIRMPGMSGMAVTEKLREAGVPTKIVIASGYAEFEYARQAIKLGAVGYCLKPFRREEIAELLISVKESLNRERQALLDELTVMLRDEESIQADRITALLSRLRLEFEEQSGLFVIVVQERDPCALFDARKEIAVQIGRGTTAYLLAGERRQEIADRLRAALPDSVAGVGIGGIFSDMTQICSQIDAAHRASYIYYISGSQRVREVTGDGGSIPLDSRALKSITDAVHEGNAGNAEQGLDTLHSQFLDGRYEIHHARQLYQVVMTCLYQASDSAEVPELIENAGLAETYRDVSDMISSLRQLVVEGLNSPPLGESEWAGTEGPDTYRQIMKYVHEHFREALSIKDIAKRFYMHPNYVSALLKKELQINFTKYVTDLRIQHACELLRTSSLEISEVAERAGYQDYFYFAKLFKKVMGLTPSDYRAGRQ